MITLVRPSPVCRMDDWSKTASTAYSVGQAVTIDDDTSGVGFDSVTTTTNATLGVVQQNIASTDADYASTTRISLLVDELGEWQVDVGAGTPTANYEGRTCDFRAGGLTVDVSTSTVKAFLIQRYVSASVVTGRIIKWVSFGYTTV